MPGILTMIFVPITVLIIGFFICGLHEKET